MIPNYKDLIKYGVIQDLNNNDKSPFNVCINKIFKNITFKARLYCLYSILFCILISIPTIIISSVIMVLCYPFHKIYIYVENEMR